MEFFFQKDPYHQDLVESVHGVVLDSIYNYMKENDLTVMRESVNDEL